MHEGERTLHEGFKPAKLFTRDFVQATASPNATLFLTATENGGREIRSGFSDDSWLTARKMSTESD
jgi:hypothetical protein